MEEIDVYTKIVYKQYGVRFIKYFFRPGIISLDQAFIKGELKNYSPEKATFEEKVAQVAFASNMTNIVEFSRPTQMLVLVVCQQQASFAEKIITPLLANLLRERFPNTNIVLTREKETR